MYNVVMIDSGHVLMIECGFDNVVGVEVLTVKSTEEEIVTRKNVWDIIHN